MANNFNTKKIDVSSEMPFFDKPFIDHQICEIILNENLVFDDKTIVQLGENICKELGLTILNTLIHNFNPHGNSILFVLSESHLALHYWPENRYIHLDLVTCKVGGINLKLLEPFFSNNKNIEKCNILNVNY